MREGLKASLRQRHLGASCFSLFSMLLTLWPYSVDQVAKVYDKRQLRRYSAAYCLLLLPGTFGPRRQVLPLLPR
jgi:hypothetical protein